MTAKDEAGSQTPPAVGEFAVQELARVRARLAKYEDAEGNPISTIVEQAREVPMQKDETYSNFATGAVRLFNRALSNSEILSMVGDSADMHGAPNHSEQVRDNRAEFKREERYMVVKLSKLADDLGGDELSREEQIYRLAHFGKALVECVVVESDWPEYEPTWAAIKARVTGSIASNQLPGGWAAKPTDDGEGFIISSPRVNGVASHFSVFPDSKDYASCALWKMLAAAPSAGSQKEQK